MAEDGRDRWGWRYPVSGDAWRLCALAILSMVVGGYGCARKTPQVKPAPPPPTYTGPAFLHGTVGSMCSLRGTEPLLVAGYGLVVNLRGTGSPDVPAFLRQWLINEMRKQGVGGSGYGMDSITPEQLLASPDTAVVLVQGLIPPGASVGTRFDVLVTALPQTQTTSLEGGQLWTVDLSRDGADPALRFSRKLAQASGPIYSDPFERPVSPQPGPALQREAVVLSGGAVTESRELELILNQPSWQRSRAIADRINERFARAPSDRFDTAVPMTDAVIRLNIPARFAARPQELLNLINHLYVQRSANFEQEQAQKLADLLVAEPKWAGDVVLAWESVGKTALPVLRRYYDHPKLEVRLAALDAGTWLEDEATMDQLALLALSADPTVRAQTARLLVNLPRSLRGTQRLHILLDDEEASVRVAAYESLATINDPIIQRVPIGEKERFKFVIDLVPSRKPLVYIAQARTPRLVIFNPTLGFEGPFVWRTWDNRLMLRSDGPHDPVQVFYQPPGQTQGRTLEAPPTLADLAGLLAHRPTLEQPEEGFDLTYGQVVDVVYALCQQKIVEAPVSLQISPLAAAIAQAQAVSQESPRPETTPSGG